MKLLKRWATFIMALTISAAVFAQSATMLSMANDELQKRGLTQAEVQNRLLQRGIDVNSISPADYKNYQGDVMAVINELEAEKRTAATAGDAVRTATVMTTDSDAGAAMPTVAVTTLAEAIVESGQEAARRGVPRSGSDIYGHSLFTDNSLDIFRTTDGAQAPDNYVLGQGDEIHISIFGSSQTEIQQRINSEGFIQPTGAAKIYLKGLTMAQARETLRNNLASYYSFRPDQIAVTITTARTVLVNIFGEVGISGGFTVSALNSAFNALAAAGGPTDIGSVRDIQIIRGSQKYSLDLYAFMKRPDGNMKLDIQNNDVIYVPTAKSIVTVNGGVLRPMRYEMLPNEGVKDLIDYAGGLRADVNMDYLQVERYDNGEIKLFEYKLSDVLAGSGKLQLQNGDIIRMRSLNQPMEKFVEVGGSVYYTGRYDLEVNRSLQRLLDNAKPTFTAKTDFLFVERTRPDRTTEVLTVPFPGIDGNPDFALQERDVVTVLDKADYRDVENISVAGQVRKPFTKAFSLNDKMTISQAIDYAGGLKESVYPVAYIYRRDLKNPSKMNYISIDLNTQGSEQLQPGDRLNVYDNSTYTNMGEVSIAGAVKSPVNLTYSPDLTIQGIITMAGGFELGAAYDRVEVFRLQISSEETPRIEHITLQVDSNYNVVSSADFALNPYDKIIVRLTPDFNTGRTVQVSGRVRYPGVYTIENSETRLSDVIEMAGGLLEDADEYGGRLYRTYRNRGYVTLNLNEALSVSRRSEEFDPIMMDQDVINIGRLENMVAIFSLGTRMSQYVAEGYEYNDTMLSNNRNERKVIVYRGNHNAAWYVRNYAGGFVKTADKRSVTVTYANNQMVGTKRVFFFFNKYPKVVSGSAITMTLSPEKIRKETEVKEKVDWDSTLAKCLTTLTSAVSLIAILTRM